MKTFAKHLTGTKFIFTENTHVTELLRTFFFQAPVKAFMVNKNSGAYISFFFFKQIDMS